MPVYEYSCDRCGVKVERIHNMQDGPPVCCGTHMKKGAGSIAFIKVEGQGFPSRRRWMDNWTPESPAFSTGSQHGERY